MPPLTSDDLEPDAAIAKRLADLKQDDKRSTSRQAGISALADGWNEKGDDWFIEVADRKYYQRDRAEDLKIVEQMHEHVRQANG